MLEFPISQSVLSYSGQTMLCNVFQTVIAFQFLMCFSIIWLFVFKTVKREAKQAVVWYFVLGPMAVCVTILKDT